GPPQGSTGYEAVDRALAGTGKQRRVSFEAVDVVTILDFVAHGLGFTLLPEYLATSRPDLRAIPLADSDMTWTLAAIMSRHQATPAPRPLPAPPPPPAPPQQPRPSPRLPARPSPGTAQDHHGGPQTLNTQLRTLAKPPDADPPTAHIGGYSRITASADGPGFRVTRGEALPRGLPGGPGRVRAAGPR